MDALLLVLAVTMVTCGTAGGTTTGGSVTTTVVPSQTPSPTGSPVIPSGPGLRATPFPLAATAALPNAEAAMARARRLVAGWHTAPLQVVGVRLMTFQDELVDEAAHGIVVPVYHRSPTPTPVWQVELVRSAPGAAPEFIVLYAVDGSVLRRWGAGAGGGGGSPALTTPAAGSAALPVRPVIPVGARLPTIDAALASGHAFASGPGGRPARAIAVQLVTLGQTWDASWPGLPVTTPVWLVTLDEAYVGHSCPAGAPPSACAAGTEATIIYDAATGWVVADTIG